MGKRKHRRGLGVVRKRKDTQKYVIDYYDNLGHRHVETIGTNHDEAVAELKERIKLSSHTATKQKVLFKTYAQEWLRRKLQFIKESTQVSYEDIIKTHLLPFFEDVNLSQITKVNIKDLAALKLKKLSPKTVRNILVVLHEILNDAEDEEVINHNPYPNKINKQIGQIAQPLKDGGEPQGKGVDHLEKDEVILFLNECNHPKEDPQSYPLFYTAIFTGVRRGELLALRWGEVNWHKKQIHVCRSLYKTKFQTPKSKHSIRDIDIENRLIKVLKQHRVTQDKIRLKAGEGWVNNDLIFCQKDGSPLDADNLYHRNFHRILKKAGLRQIRIHDLRHTFASILIAAGHNLKYIQNQMGHGSIQITMDLYGHLMKEVHDGAAEKTAGVIYGSGNVMVTDNEKGVTPETQPLEMIGSGGLI